MRFKPSPSWIVIALWCVSVALIISLAAPVFLAGYHDFLSHNAATPSSGYTVPFSPQAIEKAARIAATFLLWAALAGLAFTAAQSLDESEKPQAKSLLVSGGAMIFLGALWFLLTTVGRFVATYPIAGYGTFPSGRALTSLLMPLWIVLFSLAHMFFVCGCLCVNVGLLEILLPVCRPALPPEGSRDDPRAPQV
jgi:hypothetical protein